MQLSLVAAFIIIVKILWCGANAEDSNYTSFLLNLGYSKECIDSSSCSLISCFNGEAPPYKECCPDQENIANTLKEVKREQENVTNTLKEVKREQENQRKSSDALWEKLVKISNSLSDIKTLFQEANVTNSQSKDCPITLGTTAIPEGKKLSKNCTELKVQGEELSGVQTVHPYLPNPRQVVVYCDQVIDGGGWTVIQSRSPLLVREQFTRNWNEYVEGFGNLKVEFWLGLDNIHALTNSAHMELMVELEDAKGQKRWAQYGVFQVGDAASKYILRIEGYSGDAGDAMTDPDYKNFNVSTMKFSTFDNDNDLAPGKNCAEEYKGGWWFNRCGAAHLNGLPIVGKSPIGILWIPFRGWSQSMKKASMKIRSVSLDY